MVIFPDLTMDLVQKEDGKLKDEVWHRAKLFSSINPDYGGIESARIRRYDYPYMIENWHMFCDEDFCRKNLKVNIIASFLARTEVRGPVVLCQNAPDAESNRITIKGLSVLRRFVNDFGLLEERNHYKFLRMVSYGYCKSMDHLIDVKRFEGEHQNKILRFLRGEK